MKRFFSCSLRGGDLWSTFLTCMIVMLFALIPFEFALMNLDSPHKNPHRALTIAGCLVLGVCLALTLVFVAVKLFKKLSPAVSLGDETLSFASNSAGAAAFFSGHFEFSGNRVRFARGAGSLFKYIVFALVIPLGLWALAFFSLGAKIDSLGKATKPSAAMISTFSALQAFVLFLVFFVAIPFTCLFYRWLVEIKTGDAQVRFEGTLAKACGFLAIQTGLSVVTLGLYWPAQAIRTWKYFADRASVRRVIPQVAAGSANGPLGPIGRAGFEGPLAKGFALLWGQALLSAITLGLYFPWAFARVADYFVGHTFVETK